LAAIISLITMRTTTAALAIRVIATRIQTIAAATIPGVAVITPAAAIPVAGGVAALAAVAVQVGVVKIKLIDKNEPSLGFHSNAPPLDKLTDLIYNRVCKLI
jgi:hypothetical protein